MHGYPEMDRTPSPPGFHAAVHRGLAALCLIFLCAVAPVPGNASPEPGELSSALTRLEQAVLENPWRASRELDTLRSRLASAPAPLRLRYHLLQANALVWLYHQERLREALHAARKLVQPDTPRSTQLELAVLEGIAARRDVDYEKSARVLERARDRARQYDQPEMLALALTELAFTRSLNGYHDTALTELQEAWTLASTLNSPFLIAVIEETLGAVYGYIGEYDTSVHHYQRALATYNDLGYLAYQAEAINGLAITHRYAEKWNAAIAYFQRYREITENNQSEHNRFVAWYGLGMTYAEKGDCPTALTAIEKALEAGGPEDFRAELYKRQAVCMAEAGRESEARQALDRARQIFAALPELRDTQWAIDVQRAEALTLERLGDHEAAFDRLLAYHEQSSALQARESSERLMELRVSMENARKDMEIDLLRQQARTDALELTQRDQRLREQRILTGGLAALILMVALIVLLQWRNARRLHRLSTRDELTGLHNRRHVFSLLERLVQRLPVERGQLSIILLDVDDFKQVNDRYGHPVGDRWLKTIADLAHPLLRGGDTMARLGGEEFLVVLPRADRHQARTVAQRLVERIRDFRLPLPDGTAVRVTVSVGVASFGADCADVQALYSAADRALYAAKSRGKDQVVMAPLPA